MNTIQKAVETKECISNLAVAWHDGYYTDQQAQLSAELQDLNWNSVVVERSQLYEADANAGWNSWN